MKGTGYTFQRNRKKGDNRESENKSIYNCRVTDRYGCNCRIARPAHACSKHGQEHGKKTEQKVQFTAISMGLQAFRNDYGDYPPSNYDGVRVPYDYCGAQKLCEALLGWDLMGFHPASEWRADGYGKNGNKFTYDPDKVDGDRTLYERKDRYIDLEKANAFPLGVTTGPNPHDGLFQNAGLLDPDAYVLCDVYGVRQITVSTKQVTVNGSSVTVVDKQAKAGTPILYFRANTSSKSHTGIPLLTPPIYTAGDNFPLVYLGRLTKTGTNCPPHSFKVGSSIESFMQNPPFDYFYGEYILDPKATAAANLRPWPYNPDSYLLISAGKDGIYGTKDDITNFGN